MSEHRRGSPWEVLAVFLRLGLTSFGGPVAHLGYFREEIVVRRKWLEEAAYADLVALCQFLPGPASSQVGFALGLRRAGLPGGLAAWLGFTTPSAVALILFAYGVSVFGDVEGAGWLSGLKIAAVAVVALAVWGMAGSLCPDRPRATIAIAAAIGVVAWPTAWGQLVVIAAAGAIGWRLLRVDAEDRAPEPLFHVNRVLAAACLLLFGMLLVGLPLLWQALAGRTAGDLLQVFDSFYRAGSLVFGGGHVVLPLLQELVVAPGWVSERRVRRGLRRGAGGSRPAVHLLRVSWHTHRCAYLPVGRRICAGWHLPAILLPRHRSGAFLGAAADLGQLWRSAAGHQRGGGGAAAGRAVRPGLDQRHPRAGGLRSGAGGADVAGSVEVAAVAGGTAGSRGRAGALAFLA